MSCCEAIITRGIRRGYAKIRGIAIATSRHERRVWKAAFRARITLFAEQRQIPKSEMAWLGRLRHEDLIRCAQRHRIDYAWMFTGDLRGLLRTVNRRPLNFLPAK